MVSFFTSDFSRCITLAFCFITALGAGTNYVFSAYGEQLAKVLDLNHTQISLIASCGNAGVYFSAPAWGHVIDRLPLRIPLLISSVFLFTGYFGIHAFYTGHVQSDSAVVYVSLLSIAAGMGGSGSLLSSLNATTRSFSKNFRATASGIVLSGFGLSAFFYSFISHEAFPGNVDGFLLTLAFGTSISVLLGAFFIKIVPPESEKMSTQYDDEGQPLFEESSLQDDILTSQSPITVIKTVDFWLLFSIIALLAGTGLMWINNVGAVVQALFAYHHPHYDSVVVEQAQARQVSLLSLMNCAGRILIGLSSDFMYKKYKLDRAWWAAIISALFFISQIVAQSIQLPVHLSWATALIGLSYGSLFAIGPVLTLEMFGLHYFSSNWGVMSLAPAIAGPILNLVFGAIYDHHAPTEGDVLRYSALEGVLNMPATASTCLEGRGCYISALHLTTISCILALVLSVYGAIRRKPSTPIFREETPDDRLD
ncbi:hypothetical protein E3P89_03091 [Wallemia ichthyophaga]|uniref:Nodulin-like domain-containing protein n=1 Tax=Wallemia ichthyophaga TaxID=245174 RepID=A0A4T0JNU5_WALIC|nr:hypothetical protein E3P97_03321 [Wallemia ichthyophaga]TIA96916.1 hypothetical protein E3P95_03073 [Wallemia ichthyophaga]TIA98214.1 hypothetical protein E3P94_03033 [Wallemia ichthyophaga]TIB00872.1 hypothetical protein E3P96_02526 [Wallemia ichthyophaga]TIB09769.1 hypothetical protein E3P93_03081 [Wallemia ichthyophaga]